MLAYAANRSAIASARSNPNAMLAIIAGHVALVALVMSARMEIQRHRPEHPLIIDTIKDPIVDPPPIRTPLPPQPRVAPAHIDNPPQQFHVTPITDDFGPMPPVKIDPVPIGGGGAVVIPVLPPPPSHVTTISTGPRLLTSGADLKPPYPPSKLLNEEEGAVTVKLTIDDTGRVIAVDPVGRADSAFLDAARRHLIAHWRYKPAIEDGRATLSTTVVTLTFKLDA